ncbi:MAG: hypothetical protein J5780_04350 [Treponema sp.]|nr:hypothetical protein [Treponema sp.]
MITRKTFLSIVKACFAAFLLLFVSCKEKSPDELFKTAVKSVVTKPVQSAVSEIYAYKPLVDFKNINTETNMKVSLCPAAKMLLNLAVSETGGFSFDWLNNFKFNMKNSLKDGSFDYALTAGVNDVDVVSANIIGDKTNSAVFFQIPEIINDYIKVQGNSVVAYFYNMEEGYTYIDGFFKILPEEKVINGFVEEVMDAALSPVEGLEKELTTISAGTSENEISADYYEISLEITEELADQMIDAVIEKVSQSSNFNEIAGFISSLAGMFGTDLSKDDIKESFEGIVEDVFYELMDTAITVYTDKNGNCAGFEFFAVDGTEAVTCYIPESCGKYALDLNIADEITVEGRGKSGKKLTGDFNVMVDGEDFFTFRAKDLTNSNGEFSFQVGSALAEELSNEFYSPYDSTLSTVIQWLPKVVMKFNVKSSSKTASKYEVSFCDVSDSEYVKMEVDTKFGKNASVREPSDAIDVDDDAFYETVYGADFNTIVERLEKASVPALITDMLRSATVADLFGL